MDANVEIPYGCYWSTPFVKWQGSLQHLNSIEFAAWVARRELERREIVPAQIEHGILGTTVLQHHAFYGMPWLTGLAGYGKVTGPTVSQACATGTRLLLNGIQEIESGLTRTALLIAADRCSNSPHVYYPEPSGPGGTGTSENWLIDAFNCDPLGNHSMTHTAENVARKYSITMQEQNEVVLRRLEQYRDATKDECKFQRRYMTLPFEVPTRNLKRNERVIQGDEGVFESSAEGLAKLRPVLKDGTVTFGSQTHPADGNAAMILATREEAKTLSRDASIRIEAVGFGQARADLGFMPEATVPAAARALSQARIGANELHVVKSHNPFAVNDIVLSRGLGLPLEQMNNFGCSLVWGHPQAPTALRSIIEVIEELVLRGGGLGLFTGCAAGDSAMAVVLKVSNR
jgi:acetyl-CoA acetyltransferase